MPCKCNLHVKPNPHTLPNSHFIDRHVVASKWCPGSPLGKSEAIPFPQGMNTLFFSDYCNVC